MYGVDTGFEVYVRRRRRRACPRERLSLAGCRPSLTPLLGHARPRPDLGRPERVAIGEGLGLSVRAKVPQGLQAPACAADHEVRGGQGGLQLSGAVWASGGKGELLLRHIIAS